MDTPLIDDDHIISLLRKDAEASRLGSSLTATRRDKNAPKPNTRFLRNLVRDADSHNAALLAKEKAETRARLRGLQSGLKRDREDAGNDRDEGDSKRKRRVGEREGRWKGVLSGLGKATTRERNGDSRRERHRDSRDDQSRPRARNEEDGLARSDHKEHSKHRRRRSRSPDSRSKSPQRHHRRNHRERNQDRSRSPDNQRRHHDRKRHSRSPQHHQDEPNNTSKSSKPQHHHNSDSDSDPLTPLLGPTPPPKLIPRGRGATSTRPTIDLRFNDPTYNPRTDVALSDSENEDKPKDPWASSLEAVRDRAAWREKGAARLREAGFGEGVVGKWEGRGGEGDERALKWRGRGEGREWDLGKLEGGGDGDGEVVRGKAAWTKGLGGL